MLEYLIEKSDELSQGNSRGFPLPFRVFGITVLNAFSELRTEFLKIIDRSEEPVKGRSERCKELFVEALARPQDSYSYEFNEESDEKGPDDRVVSSRFCWAPRRLGKDMVERKDFRFLPIWVCMSWIGLRADAEELREFEAKCLSYKDTAERIEQVAPILWEVLRAKMSRNQATSGQN